MERCPACRARLADADSCPRCGVDLTLTRRAERQAQRWACLAVHQLCCHRPLEAAAAADASCALASSSLARAVLKMIRRRASSERQSETRTTWQEDSGSKDDGHAGSIDGEIVQPWLPG